MSIRTSLTAIADSIRAKTGITDKMTIAEMPALIDAIEGEGGLPGLEGIDGIISVTYESITVDSTTVVANTFNGLTGVKEIRLPNVEKLNGNNIIANSDVETLDLGANLGTIRSGALINAPKLSALIIRSEYLVGINLAGTPIAAGSGCIYVPDQVVEQFKSLDGNTAYQVKPLSEL